MKSNWMGKYLSSLPGESSRSRFFCCWLFFCRNNTHSVYRSYVLLSLNVPSSLVSRSAMKNVFLRIIPAAAISCAMVFLFVCSSVAIGQVSDQVRQRRRAFVGDLLQTILESQKDRNIVPSRPGRPNSTPLELRPGYGQGYGPVTPQMTLSLIHI